MTRIVRTVTALALVANVLSFPARQADAESAGEHQADGRAALEELYGATPSAKLLASKANAILIFPKQAGQGFMMT